MMKKKPRTPLYHFRIQKKMTIQAISDLFDVEPRTIIRWEQGETLIPVKRLADAEKIYGAHRSALRPDIFEVAG